MNEQQEKLQIKDLPGVGAVTTKKLNEVGIFTPQDLVTWNANELAAESGINRESAKSYIEKANTLLREKCLVSKLFMRADEVLERRKNLQRCTTGSQELDKLFDDGEGNTGLETSAIWEFYGEFGSGKSQICHTLCVTAQQPITENGLDGSIIYIDTEGTFRPERVKQIAKARGFDPDKILSKIRCGSVKNADELEKAILELSPMISEENVKLVIVDSIIALHRGEFQARGTLADRQQRIGSIMQKLHRISEVNNILVVITNQVVTNPGQMFGDPTIPTGGNIIGHNSTYRIYLRPSGRNRLARIRDSPSHEQRDCKFTINELGITDVQE